MSDHDLQTRLRGLAPAFPEAKAFVGFDAPTSNTTYTPNQFFDVCLPHYPRGVVRLVAYMIRKTLGWCDAEGNPQEEQISTTYQELIEGAGIGHSMIRETLDQAIAGHFVRCVQSEPRRTKGQKVKPDGGTRYELCWDDSDEYIKDPAAFRGFREGDACRTDIPNQFFDMVIPNEPLSVVKVVGSIIRFSIGFQSGRGRRRQVANLSFSAIQTYTNLRNRVTLWQAIEQAIDNNFILRVQKGLFTSEKNLQRTALYAIRWIDSAVPNLPVQPAPAQEAPTLGDANGRKDVAEYGSGVRNRHQDDLSEKRTRELSEKRTRDLTEKSTSIYPKNVPENYPKNVPVQTKQNETLNETREMKQQQQAADAALAAAVDGSNPIIEKLKNEGFDHATAALLAERHPAAQIENQLAWIGLRNTARNRLGLLRKAIEDNWPAPRNGDVRRLTLQTNGALFAAHFFAGYAGNSAQPTAEPGLSEIQSADRYVERLLAVWPEREQITAWGRSFGEYVREKNRFNDKPISFVIALRSYGDEFYRNHQSRRERFLEDLRSKAQQAHQHQYEPAWIEYLRAQEKLLKAKRRADYRSFEQHRGKRRSEIADGRWMLNPAERLKEFDTDHKRLSAFQEFFSEEVLDFWDWDNQLNPQKLDEEKLMP